MLVRLLHLPLRRHHALHQGGLLRDAQLGVGGRADGAVGVAAGGSLDEARGEVRVLSVVPHDAVQVESKHVPLLLRQALLSTPSPSA